MVDKKARETQLRLFGMRGVRNVRRATASCFCGAVLYVSEWRESATAPRQFYADAHKREFFVATRKTAWERQLLSWVGALLERSHVAFEGVQDAYVTYLDDMCRLPIELCFERILRNTNL